jgi:hypothetical protein
MTEQENSLFAIDVDADDYAEAAAEDTPAVDRTFQSKADFLAVKETYSARQDGGNFYSELIKTVPCLSPDHDGPEGNLQKLDKRTQLLLSYAVGELYYDREFEKIVELCDAVLRRCALDGRLKPGVERWMERAGGKWRGSEMGGFAV